MKSNHILKLRAGTAMQALALIGAGVGAVAFAAPAAAQDYVSGAMSGTVTNETGEAVAGATVTITSKGQGFTRTATTSSSGAFRFAGLAPGSYDVAVSADGVPGYRAEGVSVVASQTSSLDIALGAEEIVVTGAAAASKTGGSTTGLTVDLDQFVKTNPINRDLTSVVLLAPGTSLGDDGFGNLASIGGSSVAENAYYINGLNTTNFDNYLGSARVPFEFYRSVDIKSGGYSAEFGRATGGIINAVSKSGSNDFTAAIHLNYEPDAFRSNAKNLQNCTAAGVCTNVTNRAFDRTKSYSAIVEAGGPIIRDRLFFYGLAEFRRSETLRNSRTTGTGTERVQNDPFYAFKIDAYPIDGHHLEFTGFDTRQAEVQTNYAYLETGGVASLGASKSQVKNYGGGFNFVGQYTGTFADWLTISGAYGRVRDNFQNVGVDAGSAGYLFQNASGGTVNGQPQGGLYTGQTTQSKSFPWTTEREFYRGDIDLFFNAFGDHHIRAGFDVENNTLEHVSVRTGGAALVAAGWLRPAAFNANLGGAGAALILRAPDVNGGVVEVNYFNSGGAFDAQNKAFYIQDEWKLGDRLTVNLGLRRDDFKLDKPGGSPYIKLEENYAPRIAASYDLWEGETGRVYGSFGRYFLPVASNTAFRQASPEIYVRERFNYTGFGANGLPTGLTQITTLSAYQATCPTMIPQGLTPFSSGRNCNVTGDGTVKPTAASLSSTLKATRETEWIVGYEHEFGDVTLGLNYTHRNMDVSAEDVAVDAAVLAYCTKNGIAGCANTWTGFHQYVILNPGSAATFALAGKDGRTVTISAADLKYPAAKRTYDAVEFTFNRKWDGKWSLNGSYTWSKSQGNSEGFVQSDFEQSDSGITQDFDQPGFTQGAYGRLPNDRTHRFKLQGALAVTDAFTVGTNIRVESERPLSCFGFNPNPNYFDPTGPAYSDFGNAYGAASHYCGNKLSPRGTASKTDWFSSIDLSARYNVEFGDQTVTLRADVFNLLNSQSVQGRNEIGELDINVRNPNYNLPTSYQAPRYVRLGVDVAF
ncbi:MAG: TonB-dependent receptor [Sphingomonadales bacterium]|nr:MAG: TonB-dependent receptor [Sphingomonadales bacterium]